jgi:ATP-dependent 26S proteasome regulatory subunit
MSEAVIPTATTSSKSILELNNLIAARLPLIQVVTHDEIRFLKEVHDTICVPNKLQLFIWSSWQGIIEYEGEQTIYKPERASGEWEKSNAPNIALELITKYKIPSGKEKNFKGAVFAMRDFNTVLAQPVPRIMRDVYSSLLSNAKTVLCMGGTLSHGPGASKAGMEPSLEKQMIVYRWALPTRHEIENHLRKLFDKEELEDKKSKIKFDYSDDEFYSYSRALQGLTFSEIENSVVVCVTEMNHLNTKRLLEEKKQIVQRSEILEYIDSNNTMDDIGGMDNLKEYIKAHANSHTEEAVEFGVEQIKGLLLLGIPGGGKSLCAKAVGNFWDTPTLRLDIGKVMSGLVGSSEEKMRSVIATASSVAPVVLYLDEIEKALSGTKSSNASDGGTLSRVFGTLLTAMEEGLPGVTIVATANDISMLPPELIRRFNEVFYVGLPTESERKEIFSIHLKKKRRDPKDFDLDALAEASHKYTGAEIEKSIKESIARNFNNGMKKVTTEDIVQAIKDTKPLSKLMDTKIQDLVDWVRNRARFASSLGAEEAGVGNQKIHTSSGKTLDIKDLDGPDMPVKTKKAKSTSRIGALNDAKVDSEESVAVGKKE